MREGVEVGGEGGEVGGGDEGDEGDEGDGQGRSCMTYDLFIEKSN